jgi:CBS domain-containing protein
MRVQEIMSTNVQAIRPTETVTRAKALMRLRGIHHLVVIERQQVVGLLTQSALETADAEGIERVEDVMSRNVALGFPTMTIRQAANLMRGRLEGALAVMDQGKLTGIITVSDLLDVLGRGVDRPAPAQRAVLRNRGVKPRAAVTGH